MFVVVFVDACRLFLKARLGMEGVTEIPIVDREQLFCVHAIMDDSLLVIPDALEDARFRCNPMVVNEPKIRFYAGAPLVSPAGHRLGNLCLIDMVPRHLDAQQKRSLEQLSRQVSAQLELRLSLAAVCQQNRQLEKLSAEKSRFLSAVSHDIRQPLATVMMCSELMLNDDEQLLAEPHVELANASFTCAQFMHNLVDELLQMGESDFGNVPVPLDCRMTDLVALVHRVVASNALYARPKHITLHLAIEAGGGGGGGPCASPSPVSRRPEPGALVLAAPASGGGGTRELLSYDQWHASRVGARGKINLFIDPMKIEQVLNNLLSNAVKVHCNLLAHHPPSPPPQRHPRVVTS
jgi:signal transduction histidine kinase